MPLSDLELSILQHLNAASGKGLRTAEVAASLPTHGNSAHQHSAVTRTWLEALRSSGFVQSSVARRLTVWEITNLGRALLSDAEALVR
jgi:hypothetical protein